MLNPANVSKRSIYLKLGPTDMRKSINTLSILVEGSMKLNPFSEGLFVFCNRRQDNIKILYWDKNGFCLWQKRLEKDRFPWPDKFEDIIRISGKELGWLLNGLDITKAYKALKYETVL